MIYLYVYIYIYISTEYDNIVYSDLYTIHLYVNIVNKPKYVYIISRYINNISNIIINL